MYLMIWNCVIDVSIGFNVGTLSAIDLDDSTLQYGFEFNFSQFFDIGEMVSIYSYILNV